MLEEFPSETTDFLSRGAITLIKAPPPTYILIPVAFIILLFIISAGIILEIGTIESVETQGRFSLPETRAIHNNEDVIISNDFTKLGEKVTKNQILAITIENQKIISPLDGILLRKFYSAGLRIKKGEELAIVAPLLDWRIIFEVPEKDMLKIKTGQKTIITFIDITNKKLSIDGQVTDILQLNGETGIYASTFEETAPVKELLDNNRLQMFGKKVKVQIIIKTRTVLEQLEDFLSSH